MANQSPDDFLSEIETRIETECQDELARQFQDVGGDAAYQDAMAEVDAAFQAERDQIHEKTVIERLEKEFEEDEGH